MQEALDARAKLASPARQEDEERDEKRLSKADWTARATSSATFSTASTQSRRWMFGRIFGLDGRESYHELRLEPLYCPHRLSRGTAPHEREYPRRKDRC